MKTKKVKPDSPEELIKDPILLRNEFTFICLEPKENMPGISFLPFLKMMFGGSKNELR